MSLFRSVSVAMVAAVLGASPRGVDLGDLDRGAEPCQDFYAFTSGGWRAAHPMRPGVKRWGRRVAAREQNRRQLLDLLEGLSAKREQTRGSVEQQLGDYFAACMDEAGADRAGLTPLAPLLAEVDGIHDRAGVEGAIRRLHEVAIPVAFAVSANTDFHDPELMLVNIAAGGLGMPDRDYYVSAEPRFVEARGTYRAHVARVLVLGGMAPPTASRAAEGILGLEARLAESSLSASAAGDPAGTTHKVTFAELAKGRFDWVTYFEEAGLAHADVNVAEPAFLERLYAELGSTPIETWKSYLRWHVLESASPWLGKDFADESFAFKDKYLGGATERKERATVCLESTEALLGEPLGRKYAERYFPPEAKAKVEGMAREMLGVLKDEVAAVAWMRPETREQALAKIASYDVKVGYPDAWADYSTLVIRRDTLWADVAAARRFGVDADRHRMGHRVGRTLWLLPPSSPDAYIDPQLNVMGLPAGFLQAPAFDLAASDAVNYGAIGIGMAHDFTHAIDTLGADYDATGQPRNWWTDADRRAFDEASRCVSEQYEAYSIEPTVHLDGKRVRGEAIGDATGVRVAYEALKRSMRRHPVATIDGFTPEQQFFIAWGQYRGGVETLEEQRLMVGTDPHPVSRYRVIGPLSTSPEFQQAFQCKAGAPMAKPAQERCTVW
jgi:endothelin-converting enzyme/putative endopeptidase